MHSYEAPFLSLVSEIESPTITSSDIGGFLRMNSNQVKAQTNVLDLIAISVESFAEDWTRRNFLTKTWDQLIDRFPPAYDNNPRQAISLRKSPFQSIVSIKYLKNDNTTIVEVDASDYYVNRSDDYSCVLPEENKVWPTDVSNRLQSVTVQFKSGFGDKPKDVPKKLKLAMMQHAAYYFSNRGDCTPSAADIHKFAPPESLSAYDSFQIILMAF